MFTLLIVLNSIADELVVKLGPISHPNLNLLQLEHLKANSFDINLIQSNHDDPQQLVEQRGWLVKTSLLRLGHIDQLFEHEPNKLKEPGY